MSYFIRLARRAAGLCQGNSIQPNTRCWGDRIDPFENVVIRPLEIPDISSHQRAETSAAGVGKTALTPRKHRQPISSAKKNHIQPVGESTRQNVRKPFRFGKRFIETKAESTTVTHPSKQRLSLEQSGRAFERDVPDPVDLSANDYNTVLPHQQSVSSSHQQTENDGQKAAEVSRSQLIHRLADKAIANRPVTTTPRPAIQPEMNQTTTSKGIELLTPDIQRVESSVAATPVSIRAQRRKPGASQTGVAPRLIIGSLKVDVVPVKDKVNQRQTTRSATRKQKKNRKRDMSRQGVKMRFGLGQM
jgi:hypothetical protein